MILRFTHCFAHVAKYIGQTTSNNLSVLKVTCLIKSVSRWRLNEGTSWQVEGRLCERTLLNPRSNSRRNSIFVDMDILVSGYRLQFERL